MMRVAMTPVIVGMALLAAGPSARAELAVDTFEPPGQVTEVRGGAFVIDVLGINGSTQHVSADVAVRFTWKDPRLADPRVATRKVPLDSIWNPGLTVANLGRARATLPEAAEVGADGTVVYRQRMVGDFSCELDLHQFPHDRQTIGFHMVCRGQERGVVRLVPDDDITGRPERLTIPDWTIGPVRLREKAYAIPKLGTELPGLVLEMEAEREVGYYVGTIFASAALILTMAWLVYWLPIDAINPRVSVSVTSMLTFIAHRFVIRGELPRLSYLTRMDYFLLGSTALVLLGLAGVVAVFKAHVDGHKVAAIRINTFFRWAYPTVFLVLFITALA